MANKLLQSIKFPGLSDTYVVPQIDDTLSVEGRAADAKAVGDSLSNINIYKTPSITWNNGYISKSGGIFGTTGNGRYSSKFYCEKGQTINFFSHGFFSNTCMIAKVIVDGESYTPLVVSQDSADRSYTYKVNEAGYYAVSTSRLNDNTKLSVYYDISDIFSDNVSAYDLSTFLVTGDISVTQATSGSFSIPASFKKGDVISLKLVCGFFMSNNISWYYKNGAGTNQLLAITKGYIPFVFTAPEDVTGISIYINKNNIPETATYTIYARKLSVNGITKNDVYISPADGLWTTIKSIGHLCDRTNPYYIHLSEGEYNLEDEFTSEEILNANYTNDGFVGLCLYDGFYLVGADRKSTIVSCDISTDYQNTIRNQISTLNLKGECGAENITFKSNHIRYTVHDDFTQSSNSKHTFRDCVFIHLNGTGSYAYGNGMNSGSIVECERCTFIPSFLSHTSNGTWSSGSTLKLSDCKTRTAVIRDANTQKLCSAVFNNCGIREIQLTHEGGTHEQYLEVLGVNTNAIFNAPAGTIYSVGDVHIVPSLSLPVGTCVDNSDTPTSDIKAIDGIIVGDDGVFSYIQRSGYIASSIVNLSSNSDYWTVDNNNMVADGGTASNAIAIVKGSITNGVFAKLLF